MPSYVAIIRKEADSAFGVEFPDLPGCISAGDSLDRAVANAAEALRLHLQGMMADGEPLPPASSLEDIARRGIKSDLARLDAMTDDDIDYSDIPELDDEFFANAKRVELDPGGTHLTRVVISVDL